MKPKKKLQKNTLNKVQKKACLCITEAMETCLMHAQFYCSGLSSSSVTCKDSGFSFTQKLIAHYKAQSFSRIDNVVCNFVPKLVKGFTINTAGLFP